MVYNFIAIEIKFMISVQLKPIRQIIMAILVFLFVLHHQIPNSIWPQFPIII